MSFIDCWASEQLVKQLVFSHVLRQGVSGVDVEFGSDIALAPF